MTNGPEHKKIVVGSPSDIHEIRDIVDKVTSKFNRRYGEKFNVFLETIHSDTIPPGMGKSTQEYLSYKLRIEDCAIFICAFWKRIGTKIKFATGTEMELNEAIESWINKQKPQVCVFFIKEKMFPNSVKETEQLLELMKFREKIMSYDKLYFRELENKDDLEDLIEDCIAEHVCREIPAKFDDLLPSFIPSLSIDGDIDEYGPTINFESEGVCWSKLRIADEFSIKYKVKLIRPTTTHQFIHNNINFNPYHCLRMHIYSQIKNIDRLDYREREVHEKQINIIFPWEFHQDFDSAVSTGDQLEVRVQFEDWEKYDNDPTRVTPYGYAVMDKYPVVNSIAGLPNEYSMEVSLDNNNLIIKSDAFERLANRTIIISRERIEAAGFKSSDGIYLGFHSRNSVAFINILELRGTAL